MHSAKFNSFRKQRVVDSLKRLYYYFLLLLIERTNHVLLIEGANHVNTLIHLLICRGLGPLKNYSPKATR